MLPCISVENMRRSDEMTIANFVPSLELMHRAAMGVYLASNWEAPVAILVGSGNNGGDGFALACILQSRSIGCKVFTVSQRLSPDSAFYAEKAAAAGVPAEPFAPGCLAGFATAVDCLLGTGFQGSPRGACRDAIGEMNAFSGHVVSVDINSGLSGDTGEGEWAVKSDLTVTVGYFKNGLMTENAGRHMRKLRCADIGIRLERQENFLCSREEWQQLGFSPEESRALHDGAVYFRCPAWADMEVIPAAE